MAIRIEVASTASIETSGSGHIPDREVARKQKAWRACQEFESILLYQLLSTMRKASMSQGEQNDYGFGNEIFKSMIDEQLSLAIARSGGIGISKMIAKEIGIGVSQKKPVSPPHQDTKVGKEIERKVQASSIKTEAKPVKTEFQSKAKRSSSICDVLRNIERRIKPYENIISKAAHLFGVSPDLVKAVIIQESSGDPNAISRKGAKGLMQITDVTAKELGVTNPFDPVQNIYAGTRLLARLVKRFNGDVKLALASYNAGVAAVERHNGIPPYKETMDYVEKVTAYLEELRSSG